MKKYIRPESQLFVINLTEHIADASGPDHVPGGFIIYGSGFNRYYSDDPTALVSVDEDGTATEYMMDFYSLIPDHPSILVNCFG